MVELEVQSDARGVFIERKNRFTGVVSVDGEETLAHIHNTGRLTLLSNGKEVLLKSAGGASRKTSWDILSVKHGEEQVFIHSGYHSAIARAVLENFFPDSEVVSEKVVGESRLDFVVNGEICVEVKGCTLEENGVALFPDAPTKRGTKHLQELITCVEAGKKALLLILVFLKSRCFLPNAQVDPRFSDVFWRAVERGVEVEVLRFGYDGMHIRLLDHLPLCGSVWYNPANRRHVSDENK